MLELTLFDKRRRFLADAADYQYATVKAALHRADSGEFQLRVDDAVAQYLQADGCRYVATLDDVFLSSGRIRSPRFGLGPAASTVYQLTGDYSILEDTLAWVNPARPIKPATLSAIAQAWQAGTPVQGTVEGQSGYYQFPAEVTSAEAAIKNLIQANVIDRLGRQVTVAPNLDRGGNARTAGALPNVRFSSVAEAVQPLLDWSGLVLTVQQNSDGAIVVETTEPGEFGQELDTATGTLDDGSGTLGYPDATRVVVMGPGELAARAFDLFTDPGLEDRYGHIIEVTREATSAGLEWPESLSEKFRVPAQFVNRPEVPAAAKALFNGYMRAAAEKALTDARPSNALAVDIAATDAFRYGQFFVGDWIVVEAHEQTFSEQITSLVASVTTDGKQTVKPALGTEDAEGEDPEAAAIWRAMGKIAKNQRGQAAGR